MHFLGLNAYFGHFLPLFSPYFVPKTEFLLYRKIEIRIGVRFVGEGEMPPLAIQSFEPMTNHSIVEQMAVE